MGSWKKYAAAFLVNAGLTVLVLLIRGFDLKIYYVDAFSVAGGVSILLGMFSCVVRAGAFDTIGYGFSTLRADRRDKDLYEYVSRKKEQRSRQGRSYLSFFVLGLLFLGIAFLIWWI